MNIATFDYSPPKSLTANFIFSASRKASASGFEPQECLLIGNCKRTSWLPCWLQRGEQVSHQMRTSMNMWHIRLHQAWLRLHTLVFKSLGEITKSPKKRYQLPHKKDLCPPKRFLKKTLCGAMKGNLQMSHFAYTCKMQYPLNLVFESREYLWFYWTFCIVILDYGLKLHKLSNHTLVMLQKQLEIH